MKGFKQKLGRSTHIFLGAFLFLIGLSLPLQSQSDERVEEMILGNPDAPVILTEYASLTCPYCAQFHQNVYPELKKNYIDNDKILFRFREVYFDRMGLWASIVARCGGSEKYFGIIDLLFASQKSWSTPRDAGLIVERLMEIGRAAGLSNDALQVCLTDAAKAKRLNDFWEENRKEDNIDSTPTFVINGKLYSNMTYDELSSLLDDALMN